MESKYDGSPSLSQQVEHARVNFPDKLSMYLELTDNSFDHGNATKAGIVISDKTIAHIDNGTFSKERVELAWCKNTENLKEYYTSEYRKNKLGKWNCGLTDASIIWGDKATLFIKNTDEEGNIQYFVNLIDWDRCKEENKYVFEYREANANEIKYFQKKIQSINDGEDWSNVTVVEFSELLTRNNKQTFDDMIKTYKGVYGGKHSNKEVKIIHKDKLEEIQYEEFLLNDDFQTRCYHYYSKDNGDSKIIEEGKLMANPTFNKRFTFYVKYGILSKDELTQEKEYFGLSDLEMSGHRIYRGNRCVSGKLGLQFGGQSGMYRNRGGRAYWLFPAGIDIVDTILSIGTNKQIREHNYEGIKIKSKSMSKLFDEIYKRINLFWEQYMKKKKEDDLRNLKKIEKKIKKLELEQLEEELEKINQRFKKNKFIGDDGEIYDGRSTLHRTATKIKETIEEKIAEKKAPPQNIILTPAVVPPTPAVVQPPTPAVVQPTPAVVEPTPAVVEPEVHLNDIEKANLLAVIAASKAEHKDKHPPEQPHPPPTPEISLNDIQKEITDFIMSQKEITDFIMSKYENFNQEYEIKIVKKSVN